MKSIDFLTVDEFVRGPDNEEVELDIDRIFGKKFSRIRFEALQDTKNAFDFIVDEPATLSDLADGYTFQPVEAGLALLNRDGEIIGGYIFCDVSIDENHQGIGLGAELILEYYLRNEEFPVWNLDAPAFTPAGLAAHESAWRMAKRNPSLVNKKLSRIFPDEVLSSKSKKVGP